MEQPKKNNDAPNDASEQHSAKEDATLAFVDSTAGSMKRSGPGRDDPVPGVKIRYLGDYELLHEIARGGMGVVFKARQTTLNRIVAVKMILAGELAGEQEIERFHAEAQSAAKLDHSGIVPIYEVGRHEGHHYFSMGFVEGASLDEQVKQGPLRPREAAEMTRKIALAIAYAHGQGVVHRDLKPANVLIDQQGEPRVTDFGLAKQVRAESNLTATGQVLGTPAYMPPEQAAGDLERVDARSDVYSLGALLYCLLTGKPPFQAANPIDTLLKVMHDEPVSPRQLNPSVPRDLETICLKCLSKEKERRYGSADDLARDLDRYLNDEPIAARPASLAYKYWRKVKRNRATSLATAAAVVAVVCGLAFYSRFRQSAREFAIASQTAKGAQEALQRIQGAEGIQQLAVLSFRNLSGNKEDDWLSAGFASEVENNLSGVAKLKVVGKALVEDASAELGLPVDATLDATAAQKLGKRLVVNHVVIGEFQRLADQIQVSACIVNIATSAIDQGGMRVQGKFPDDVFKLQADLASQCIAKLGVGLVVAGATVADEPAPTPENEPQTAKQNTEQPAASVEAWVLLGQGQHALRSRNYDEAIRLLSQAIEADPTLGKAYRALGQAYQQSERNEDAVAAFKKAVELDKTDLVSLTCYNMLSGRIAEGSDAMTRALEAGVADLDMLKMSALVRLLTQPEAHGGSGAKVTEEVQQALKKHPTDDVLWMLLGMCHAVAGDKKACLEALEKAVEVAPDSYRARICLALQYGDDKRKDDAEKQLAEAEKRRPPGAAGFRAFGAVYLHVGKLDEAIKEFQRALEIEPANGRAHALLGQAYAQKGGPVNVVNARAQFEKALDDEPRSAQILGALCRLTNLLGENDRLAKYAAQWAATDPESYEAHQYLRIAYLKTDQQASADAEAKLLSGLTPTHASFFFLTGNALLQAALQGNETFLDEALAVLQKGHSEFPDNKGVYSLFTLAQGWKLMSAEQGDLAIIALQKSMEAASAPSLRDIAATDSYFLLPCLQKTGRNFEAAELARKYLEAAPQYLPVALKTFVLAGRWDYAASAADKWVKANPTDTSLHKNLIDFYSLAGRLDDAKSFVENYRASTAAECQLRVEMGAKYADWMESRTRFDAAGKQAYLDTLMRETRDRAAESGGVESAYLDTLETWLKSPQPWLVAGPFPGDSDFDAALPPETGIDPDTHIAGANSTDIRWRVASVRPGSQVYLHSLYPGSQPFIAYAASYIQSTEDQTVTLRFGAGDQVKVWLGDEIILQKQLGRGPTDVKVKLAKGPNRLLIKSINRPVFNSSFNVSAVDAKGWPTAVKWTTDADPELGAARELAHGVWNKLLLKDEVLGQLKDSAAIAEPLRDAAVKIVESLAQDPVELNRASWSIGQEPNRDQLEYALALRQAAAACRADEANWTYLTTLGAAQYRAGDNETALATISRAEQLCRAETGCAAPAQWAVKAMAHHRLGHAEESRACSERCGDLLRGEGFARDEVAQRLRAEVQSELKDIATHSDEKSQAIESVKKGFVMAHQAGWMHHDLESYMEWFAADVQNTSGRGEQPGPYDVTNDRPTFEVIDGLSFQTPPPTAIRFAYDLLDVQLTDDGATLNGRATVQYDGGYQTWGGKTRLRKTADGWKAYENRSWQVNKKAGDELITFDTDRWRQLDVNVEECRAQGDLGKLAQALADANRFAESHQVTKDLTAKTNAPAADWTQRADTALRAGDYADAIASYKKALVLEPNAPIPPYKELIVAAPSTLKLEGVDLPADREVTSRSPGSKTAAELVVHNGTAYTLCIYWLNFEGKRELYKMMPPGATWSQPSFVKHLFLVSDTAGRAFGVLEVKKEPRTVTLSEVRSADDPASSSQE